MQISLISEVHHWRDSYMHVRMGAASQTERSTHCFEVLQGELELAQGKVAVAPAVVSLHIVGV
jgi:hypothetical protein